MSALRDLGAKMDERQRSELLSSIEEETARLARCELVTLDADFRGLPGVVLIEADE